MSKVIGATVGTPFDPNKLRDKVGNFLVTVTKNEDETYTADKTYAELVSAKNEGKTLFCWYYDDDIYLPQTMFHGLFVFSGVVDHHIYQVNIPYMEQITITKTDIPDLEGYATERYVDEAIANIDLPTGVEGGNNTFYYELTLEKDREAVNIQFPVNWEKILQFNIHMNTNLPADMAMETFTGTGWAKHGTLPAGLKGLNIYGITYAWDTYSTIVCIDVSTGGAAHDLAIPKFATQGRLAHRAGNTLGLYSTTSGAVFPAGTKFDVWGVYAP